MRSLLKMNEIYLSNQLTYTCYFQNGGMILWKLKLTVFNTIMYLIISQTYRMVKQTESHSKKLNSKPFFFIGNFFLLSLQTLSQPTGESMRFWEKSFWEFHIGDVFWWFWYIIHPYLKNRYFTIYFALNLIIPHSDSYNFYSVSIQFENMVLIA